jgi:hypothetical protein
MGIKPIKPRNYKLSHALEKARAQKPVIINTPFFGRYRKRTAPYPVGPSIQWAGAAKRRKTKITLAKRADDGAV